MTHATLAQRGASAASVEHGAWGRWGTADVCWPGRLLEACPLLRAFNVVKSPSPSPSHGDHNSPSGSRKFNLQSGLNMAAKSVFDSLQVAQGAAYAAAGTVTASMLALGSRSSLH